MTSGIYVTIEIRRAIIFMGQYTYMYTYNERNTLNEQREREKGEISSRTSDCDYDDGD